MCKPFLFKRCVPALWAPVTLAPVRCERMLTIKAGKAVHAEQLPVEDLFFEAVDHLANRLSAPANSSDRPHLLARVAYDTYQLVPVGCHVKRWLAIERRTTDKQCVEP